MATEGRSGVTSSTSQNIFFGAGTVHKNLTLDSTKGTWNFDSSCVGATNGGSTLTITPEFYDVPVDGPSVLVKDLKYKVGETATLEVNFAELTADIIKALAVATTGTSEDDTYDLYESQDSISSSDYWDNIAFVGKTLDNKDIIIILENALCTSGLPLSGTNKESATVKATFECHAAISSTGGDLTKLPWHIYYPKATVVTA